MRILGIDLSYAGHPALGFVENGRLREGYVLPDEPKKTTKSEKHLFTTNFDIRDYRRCSQFFNLIDEGCADVAIIEYPAAIKRGQISTGLFMMMGLAKTVLYHRRIPFFHVYTSQVRKILGCGSKKEEAVKFMCRLFPSLYGKPDDLIDAYSFALAVSWVQTGRKKNPAVMNSIKISMESRRFKKWKA